MGYNLNGLGKRNFFRESKLPDFLPIDEYHKIACKVVISFLGERNGYCRKILADDGLLTDIASALMKADSLYDPERGACLKTVRFTYARNVILRMIKLFNRNREVSVGDFEFTRDYRPDYLSEGEKDDIDRSTRELLSDREYSIIRKRFYDGRTLESVGQEIGVSRERVRQIEEGALNKLREKHEQFA